MYVCSDVFPIRYLPLHLCNYGHRRYSAYVSSRGEQTVLGNAGLGKLK